MLAVFKKMYWLVYPLLGILFLFIFDQIYQTDNLLVKTLICFFLAYLLSPKKKTVETQTGERTQITWIFLKKAIYLD